MYRWNPLGTFLSLCIPENPGRSNCMSSDPHDQLQVLGTLKRSYYKSVPLCELHGDINSSRPKRYPCEEVWGFPVNQEENTAAPLKRAILSFGFWYKTGNNAKISFCRNYHTINCHILPHLMWVSTVSRINFIIIHISREQKELFKNIPNYIPIFKKNNCTCYSPGYHSSKYFSLV